jgi:tetratricopeptide repeat protein
MPSKSWIHRSALAAAITGVMLSTNVFAHGGGGGHGGGFHGGGFGGGGHHGGGFSGAGRAMSGHYGGGGNFAARNFGGGYRGGAGSFVNRYALGSSGMNRGNLGGISGRYGSGYRGVGGLGGLGYGGLGYGGLGYGGLGYGGLGYGGLGYGGLGYGGIGGLGFLPFLGLGGLGYGGYGGYGGNGGYGGGYGGYSNYGSGGYSQPAYVTTDGTSQMQAADFASRGEQDFQAGRYDDAVKDWQHALVDNPQNGGLAMLLGQALFATGRFEEAAGATQLAMHMLPQDQWGSVITHYRELYPPNQDYNQQLRALETAVKSHDSPASRFLLGFQYGYLGYPKEAVRELDKALKLNSQDQMAKQLRDIMAAKLPAESVPAATASG